MGDFLLVSINVRCVCLGSMDSQMAEQILMKLRRHDPRTTPSMVFHQKNENITPGGGKGNF